MTHSTLSCAPRALLLIALSIACGTSGDDDPSTSSSTAGSDTVGGASAGGAGLGGAPVGGAPEGGSPPTGGASAGGAAEGGASEGGASEGGAAPAGGAGGAGPLECASGYELVGDECVLDSPSTLQLALWFDASEEVGLNPDGRVAIWQDRRGGNFPELSAAGASRPKYSPDGMGGRPVIRFEGGHHS